ncbi:MAG TPA: hypothetical protein VLC93_00825, partial [Myxococcota bacterium]|nr:hypothetical protein [Myxococcota bacterium]
PEPRPEPSSAGPSADAASPPPAKVMKDEAPKADEKGRARASESAKAASSPADDGGDEVPATSVSINRDVGGRPRALSSGDVVPSATLLKVVAQGGRYITVIGVRRDGVPHVYGQAESPTGQPVTVQVRLRPASSRVSEALFVVVGDAPMPSGKAQVSSGKDAAQLPLRLTVAGAQRRYVVIMSASAD